jgi:hypothetical protein
VAKETRKSVVNGESFSSTDRRACLLGEVVLRGRNALHSFLVAGRSDENKERIPSTVEPDLQRPGTRTKPKKRSSVK